MKIYEVLGPHENIELVLMLNNKKQVALISKEKFEKFIPYLKNNNFSYGTVNVTHNTKRYIVTQPSKSYLIDLIKNIYNDVKNNKKMENYHHVALGKLLGYTEKDINEFIGFSINNLSHEEKNKINYFLRV